MLRLSHLFILAVLTFSGSANGQSAIRGKRICIDPGHGGTAATDKYRVGRNGEREEWINLRVALALKKMLTEAGAHVVMTRERDEQVDLVTRAKIARDSVVDVFLSIHHNATADSTLNFPIVYFHGAASENLAGVELAKCVAKSIKIKFYKHEVPASVVSDYTIFPEKGAAVLRETYGIPGLLGEASFFTNEAEEERLKTKSHNDAEARAYFEALQKYFQRPAKKIRRKRIPLQLPRFEVLQEEARMLPEALKWLDDFEAGKRLLHSTDTNELKRAYELFTRSARSVPDSWVARECHLFRSQILSTLKKTAHAKQERQRAVEYYVPLEDMP
jgi:N-acetylmuramoyl-L-alanine amidase